jgi:GTP cyclohydrolase II
MPFRYLVYNLRKRGGDSADKYFKSTELIAGVKDMRFQALMPDVLHWLGIKKIDNMVSMSDMFVLPANPLKLQHSKLMVVVDRKYNAIVQSGIPILKRYDIPGMFFLHVPDWHHESSPAFHRTPHSA